VSYTLTFQGSAQSASALMVAPAHQEPLDSDTMIVTYVFERLLSQSQIDNLGFQLGLTPTVSDLEIVDHEPQDAEFALIYGVQFKDTLTELANIVSGVPEHDIVARIMSAYDSMLSVDVSKPTRRLLSLVALSVLMSDDACLYMRNAEIPLSLMFHTDTQELAVLKRFIRLVCDKSGKHYPFVPTKTTAKTRNWMLKLHRQSALAIVESDMHPQMSELLIGAYDTETVNALCSTPKSYPRLNRVALSILFNGKCPQELAQSVLIHVEPESIIRVHGVQSDTLRTDAGDTQVFSELAVELAQTVRFWRNGKKSYRKYIEFDDTALEYMNDFISQLSTVRDVSDFQIIACKIAGVLAGCERKEHIDIDTVRCALRYAWEFS
jgi:hypothetical protein